MGYLDESYHSDMGYEKPINKRKYDAKEQLRRRIEQHDNSAARLQERLDILEAIPDEPDNEIGILYFQKMYDKNGRTYSFAAIKVKENGLWYLTGPAMGPRPMAWEDLWSWMHDGAGVIGGVWIATELAEL